MWARSFLICCISAFCIDVISGGEDSQNGGVNTKNSRDSKLLPIFQIVRFPNDICSGGTRNGTCYTSEECSSKGGTNSGSCASGFGVCCTFTMACGDTRSENCTYIVQGSATSGISTPCTYTICPCSSNICRIRYDFKSFTIASAQTGKTVTAAAAVNDLNSQGHCVTDSFSIAAPGAIGTPIICGTNTGYHMILDANEECHEANFLIGAATTTTRVWDIKVTQYSCGEETLSGPPGCMQYYTSTTGTVQNYGWPTGITGVLSTVTHLARQNYDICFRRGSGFCYICYSPTINPAGAAIAQISFGLSVSSAAGNIAAQSATASDCLTDYLEIPNASTAAISATTLNGVLLGVTRFCGRFFNIASGTIVTLTVCSKIVPFRIGVTLDGAEVGTAADMADSNEKFEDPGGITGFQLNYWQRSC